MKAIFKNPTSEKQFREQGYVVVDLLDETAVNTLRTAYDQHKENVTQPFHTTHFSTDPAYKQQVHDTISNTVFSFAGKLLNDFTPVFGNFMVKQTGPNSEMPLHADWSYVQENGLRSLAIWVPLVDTNKDNGCLGVIPGSHRISPAIRGPRLVQAQYENFKKWIEAKGKLLSMKAGQAVFYDHALMHYSPPNMSAENRPALNLSCVPQGAVLFHHCVPEGKEKIQVYKVEGNSFFIHYNNYQAPTLGTVTGTLEIASVPAVNDKMDEFCRPQKPFKAFITKLFG